MTDTRVGYGACPVRAGACDHTPAAAPGRILLINPNSAAATTDTMVAIAQAAAGSGFRVAGATASRAPPLIVDPVALRAAADEVVGIALSSSEGCDGMVVAAFGDPGLAEVRARIPVPVVGIAEAAMLDAAYGGRRFGIATTTPGLVPQIDARVAGLGLAGSYTGTRTTEGNLLRLMGDPGRLRTALAQAAGRCVAQDGAEAVIIGGGPLGQAAAELQAMFAVPIIAPIPAAIRRLLAMIGSAKPAGAVP